MTRINLLGGTYQARSVIADAQRCINLYPEMNPPVDQDHPITHYLTPGTNLLSVAPVPAMSRCNYRASNGEFYRVVGINVYLVDPSWNHTLLGSISMGTTICSMSDNGLVVVLVDGSTTGYAIDMVTHEFQVLTSPNFLGADKADYLDTFLLFNVPGTNEWYISLSEVDFGILTGSPGGIDSGTISTPGTGYVTGTYSGVALSGGTGEGALGTFIVDLTGAVTSVTITTPGADYVIGDQLSVDNTALGGTGTGFDYNVDEITGAGFDPLDIATKDGSPDPIVTLAVVHTEIWLIGELTSEVWYNSGASDFTFQRLPGTFIEHGIAAIYSLAKEDLNLTWLSQDREGHAIVVMTVGYEVIRISTHAIENAISNYTTINDAIGFMYQQEGHVFYVLVFPTANATWVYDKASKLWHQRTWTDADGNLNRIRANCSAFAHNQNVLGDYVNGNLLEYDLDTYTDYVDGAGPNSDGSYPMSRIRAFPHIMNDDMRVTYSKFTADMESGNDTGSIDSTSPFAPPLVSLRYSNDRGRSYGNKMEQSLGSGGQYLTSMQWRRLGYARDRVFELSWSTPTKTALQGAFIDIVGHAS